MASIAIITDTDSSLPASLAAQFDIRLVPIGIHFGATAYETGVTIDDARLFAQIDRAGVLPTTAAPTPGRFIEAYQSAFDGGAESAICLCVSSGVSSTYQAALAARETLPERDITIIDTRSLSMGQGFMALTAAEAAQAGRSKEEVIATALSVGERVHIYTALATLKYLAMSGRVGSLTAGIASLLDVKPILTLRDGKLDMLERVRTRGKSWARVVELTARALGGRPAERMAIMHVNAPEAAQELASLAQRSIAGPETIVTVELTPGLSVHTGPGLVGIVVVAGRGAK